MFDGTEELVTGVSASDTSPNEMDADTEGTDLDSSASYSDGSTGTDPTSGTSGDGTVSGQTTSDDGYDDDDDDDDGNNDGNNDGAGNPTIDCSTGDAYHVLVDASEAQLTSPMERTQAWGSLAGQALVAHSVLADQGAALFEVNVPCDGVHYISTLVWDRYAGGSPCGEDHADSYWFAVDGGTEFPYFYGCGGCGGPDEVWEWRGVHESTGDTCEDRTRLELELAAGLHTITLRNRENGSLDLLPSPDVAAVAAVLVTNDPAYDPNQDLVP